MPNLLSATALTAALLLGSAATAREWTDVTGKYKLEAEFVELADGAVKLRRADGKIVSVPLAKLSPADRRAARQMAAAAPNRSESTAPAAAQPPQNAAAPAGAFQVRVSARIGSGYRMDQQGNPLPPDLVVDVAVTGKAAADAKAYGYVKVDEVRAGGKPLEQYPDSFVAPRDDFIKIVRDTPSIDQVKQPDDGIAFPLVFENAGGAKKVDLVRGSFKMRTGGNTTIVKAIELEKKESLDEPALKELGVACKVSTESQDGLVHLRLDFSGKTDAIHGVTVETADGQRPENWAGSGEIASDGEFQASVTFQDGLPPGHVLKIILLTGAEEIDVPFSARDVPIAPPQF